MKLLIVTQAVDLDDPVLGFFHRWVVEFSKRCETVHVICLKEGRHALPPNVLVHSLGKESGRSRMKYVSRFYHYIRAYRKEYDAVFVHMNPEYICLGGFLWRMWNKPVGLWYVHWSVTWKLRFAMMFTDRVLTASQGSFPVSKNTVTVLGHGIDTTAFAPAAAAKKGTILFLARLDPVKRADVFVRSLDILHERGTVFSADLIGAPSATRSEYAHTVRNLASPLALAEVLSMRGAVTNEEARTIFAAHEIFCNLSPQGQFDKTLLEAMASGCIVVSNNEALRDVIPLQFMPKDDSPGAVASALQAALNCSEEERRSITHRSRSFVEREHSLASLVPKILATLKA